MHAEHNFVDRVDNLFSRRVDGKRKYVRLLRVAAFGGFRWSFNLNAEGRMIALGALARMRESGKTEEPPNLAVSTICSAPLSRRTLPRK